MAWGVWWGWGGGAAIPVAGGYAPAPGAVRVPVGVYGVTSQVGVVSGGKGLVTLSLVRVTEKPRQDAGMRLKLPLRMGRARTCQ